MAQTAGARWKKTYSQQKATLLMLSSAHLHCVFLLWFHLKNSTLNLHCHSQILRNKGNMAPDPTSSCFQRSQTGYFRGRCELPRWQMLE